MEIQFRSDIFEDPKTSSSAVQLGSEYKPVVRAWLWSFSNQDVSVYTIDPTRSQGVVEEILGEVFSGVLCSDFYGAYHKIESVKQKCWAHILRDLKNLRGKEPDNLEVKYFASRLKNFFDRGKVLREAKALGEDIESRMRRLKSDTESFACRKFKHPELQTLAKRLIKYRREMYTFVEKNLEPTNNNSEREIRPADKRGQNFVSMATDHLAGYQ
jgi:transposase